MKSSVVVALLFVVSMVTCTTHAGVADTSCGISKGFLFAASYWPSALSVNGRSGSAQDFGAVVGYRTGSALEPWMAFLTGQHKVPGVAGPLSFGGFAAGATVHFLPRAYLQPLLSLFFDMGTLLDGTGAGYNQAGYRIALGGWLGLSKYFAVDAQMMYGRDYRTRWIGDASDLSGTAPQSTMSVGGVVMLIFYPEIFP